MGMWKSLVIGLGALLVLAGAACSSTSALPRPGTPDRCGNPCAVMACPAAFRCDVDASCTARCNPENIAPGRL
jgi:hypothetical protein